MPRAAIWPDRVPQGAGQRREGALRGRSPAGGGVRPPFIAGFHDFRRTAVDRFPSQGREGRGLHHADAHPGRRRFLTCWRARTCLGCAQTGTGKTAAFALPILQRLPQRRRQPEAARAPAACLVLTPTRELAAQIDESFACLRRSTCRCATRSSSAAWARTRRSQALRAGRGHPGRHARAGCSI